MSLPPPLVGAHRGHNAMRRRFLRYFQQWADATPEAKVEFYSCRYEGKGRWQVNFTSANANGIVTKWLTVPEDFE